METNTRFISQQPNTHDSISFLFEKPDGFNYQAGQFMWLTIPHTNPDDRGIKRHFTISSSPTEPNLMLTTKFSENGSTFKQALKSLKPGTEVVIRGPHGEFVLPNNPVEEIVLLGGGIGITPFRSMLIFVSNQHLNTSVTLIYSNKTSSDIVYHDEFDRLQNKNPNFQAIYTIDNPELNWHGSVGHLNPSLIKQSIKELNKPLYYICGPSKMVESYQKMLLELNIPYEKILIENFSGYV